MGRRGPQKGTIYRPTLDKAMQREELRAIVAKHMGRMVRSQIAASIGIGHVFTRDKNGKFTRIEDEAKAEALLTQAEEGKDYWIFMKDPSTAAFTDLMNRALDLPAKPTEEHEHRGEFVFRWETEK